MISRLETMFWGSRLKMIMTWPISTPGANFMYQNDHQGLHYWNFCEFEIGQKIFIRVLFPCRLWTLESWITNLKLELLLGEKWPKVVKANIFLSKSLLNRIFCLTQFSLFDQVASFDLSYLPRPMKTSVFFLHKKICNVWWRSAGASKWA